MDSPPMQWQPLETAKKDGSPVICASFTADNEVEFIAVRKWQPGFNFVTGAHDVQDEGEWVDVSISRGGGYTHWMPTPAI